MNKVVKENSIRNTENLILVVNGEVKKINTGEVFLYNTVESLNGLGWKRP